MDQKWIDENEQILFSGRKPDNGHYVIYNEDLEKQTEFRNGELVEQLFE
jgi:hypothetical protein